MKNQWMAYVIVAVISVLAGVAIAGPPNTVGTEIAISVPESTTTTTDAPAVTDAPTTTVDPEPVETEPADTEPVETEPADTTTTTTTTTEPEIDATEVVIVAVNGAGTQGLATGVRNELIDLGFEQVRATDGSTFVDVTVVYFVPGFEREAVAVAEALGLELTDVKPIEEAPRFGQNDGDQVAVYLGRDRG